MGKKQDEQKTKQTDGNDPIEATGRAYKNGRRIGIAIAVVVLGIFVYSILRNSGILPGSDGTLQNGVLENRDFIVVLIAAGLVVAIYTVRRVLGRRR